MHQESKSTLIVISAAAFEYAPLQDQIRSCSFFSDYEFLEIGIGPLHSTEHVAKNLSKFENKHVLYIGTAGSFSPFSGVKVFRAASVQWLPTCERHGLSYAVKPLPPLTLDQPFSKHLNLETVDVICAPNVSLSTQLPEGLDPTKSVENLELYSCASQLIQIASSFTAVIGVTNAIGKDAHKEWKSNYKLAAELSAESILSSLKNN